MTLAPPPEEHPPRFLRTRGLTILILAGVLAITLALGGRSPDAAPAPPGPLAGLLTATHDGLVLQR